MPLLVIIALALAALIPPAPTPAATCQPSLAYGQTALCALASAGEVASFTLDTAAGDRVLLRMARDTSGFLPRIRVVSPSSATVCQAQGSSSFADLDSCVLAAAGTYTLLADSWNGTGTGSFGISVQRLNSPAGAQPLAYGQAPSAALAALSEIDTYSFGAQAGDSLVARMTSTASGLTPLVRIYRPDGTLLCSGSSYSRIADTGACVAPSAGTYALVATTYSSSGTGTYAVGLQRANGPAGAPALAFGQPQTASLVSPAELDAYTFQGFQQQTVVVRMGTTTASLSPLIRIYGPDGVLRCSAYDYSHIADITCLLPSNGAYTIIASSFSDALTGNYGISLQRVQSPGAAAPLEPGVIATSVLTAAGQLATYTFDGAAGDSWYLRMAALQSSVQPLLRVFAPDGSQVCGNYSYSEYVNLGPCLLPSDGSYTVLASAFSDPSLGGYGITAQRIRAPGHAAPLYFGREGRGALDTAATLGTFTFRASASSSVTIRMSTASGASTHPMIHIFSPDGPRVCLASSYGASATSSTCVLPVTGTYTVLASSIDTGTGGYTLLLSCQSGDCGGDPAPTEYARLPLVVR